ncbi:hypothetical protein DY000_02063247 [Brassica cretica]|uniref:Uncharacterized protein n=1 Tax=Brassica cretica TaxID=69181 RepID=A0ABQ7AYA3_BRACR|nr:hypothetical protein DY000_02063247 [Brassica cretica]
MKTTQQSIDYNSQFLVDRGLDPKPDFCDPNLFLTFSSRPTSRLVLNWSPLELISLHLKRTFSSSECVQMRGGRGLFIGNSNQSGTSRVADRVSLRMAPDACTATPRAPLGWLHVSVSCRMTPHPLPVWPHGPVACIATPRAWLIHLVLLCVTPHDVIICTVTARASLATYHARQLPPRPDLIDRATSSFSVHSSNFGLSGEFFPPAINPNIFRHPF